MQRDRITIRGVDPGVADALRAYTLEHGMTLGECITEAIEEWLASRANASEVDELLQTCAAHLDDQQRLLNSFILAVGVDLEAESPQAQ